MVDSARFDISYNYASGTAQINDSTSKNSGDW